MDTVLVIVEAVIVLAAIFLGVRTGGIGLGLWGIAATLVLVFVFGLTPGSPPIAAIGIILAVITASAAMQAAGGIDYLVQIATKLLRRNPARITFYAPLIAFFFTVGAGTSNIFFSLIPVIKEVSLESGVRPERPLAAATVTSGLGITASPVSAAMAAYLGLLPEDFGLVQVLSITIPASIVACLVVSFVSSRIGRPLEKDETFRARVAAGECRVPAAVAERDPSVLALVPATGEAVAAGASGTAPAGDVPATSGRGGPSTGGTASGVDAAGELRPGAVRSTIIFGVGVLAILILGLFEDLRPVVGEGEDAAPLSMTTTIILVMFTVALVIILWNGVKPAVVATQNLVTQGVVAIIALFGIATMADTFLANNQETIVDPLASLVESYPLMLAVAVFLVAGLTTSQSATTVSIMPFGLAALSPAVATAMWPSLIGVWLFPANGPQIAAVNLDETGSTRLTSIPVYHSFTVPMLVAWVSVVVTGLLISPLVG